MGKESCRKKMSRVARSMNVIRKSLKAQEATNKALRDQITPIWEDKTKDGIVKDLSNALAVGRSYVRAYQTVLHELKVNMKTYNFEYDCLAEAERDEMALSVCQIAQPQMAS